MRRVPVISFMSAMFVLFISMYLLKFVPILWDKMNSAQTSFVAEMWGLGLFVTIGQAIFFAVVGYEIFKDWMK